MKIEILVRGVILFTEDRQFKSSYAFMRLQSFYENADKSRQGKYFSLDDVIEHSATVENQKVEFDFLEKWGGFNVPDHVVKKFIKLYEHDFTRREKSMFDALKQVIEQEEDATTPDGKFYLIGTYSADYIDHELCHAMWYLYPEFKKQSIKAMKKLPKAYINAMKTMLIDGGYADNVLDDEINAYLATSNMYYTKEICLEHLSPSQLKKFNWDKIYAIVNNYWTFKENNLREYADQEIILC